MSPGRSASGWRARAPSDVSLIVGRTPETVVLTVEGKLTLDGCHLLGRLLTDLIEGQGNLAVAVDLGGATVEPEALTLFVGAARRARDHGTRFILKEPPIETREALHLGGLADAVELLPRRRAAGE